jgi:hypothetical protein
VFVDESGSWVFPVIRKTKSFGGVLPTINLKQNLIAKEKEDLPC